MNIRITILLISLFTGIQLYSQTAPKGICFKERIFNFGKIKESKGQVSHTFTFWNRSKYSIVIEKIATGCGCTTFSYTKEPIKSGHKGEIEVSFDPKFRSGFFSKEITVFSNNNNISRVWIKGYVLSFIHPVGEDYPYSWGHGLYTSLKVVAFGEMTYGKQKQIKLRYANNTNKPMILNFVSEEGNKNLKFSNPGILPTMKRRGEMIISYTMSKREKGKKSIKIYPIINGNKLSEYIEVQITCI